jgi:uncharacterized membrane protein YfcA
MLKSKLFTLKVADFVKGLVVAILTAVGTFLSTELQVNQVLSVELFKKVVLAALIACIAYLVKNIFTNSKGELLKPE